MARSMTAYGRAHAKTSGGVFLIEIHSVNRKSLDISANLPKEFLSIDMDLRSLLSDEVKRGYVTIRITKEGSAGAFVIPSVESLEVLHTEWAERATALGYNAKEAVPFSMIMQFALGTTPPVAMLDETLKKQLLDGFKTALEAFVKMKEIEGEACANDIAHRLQEIDTCVDKVKTLAPFAPQRYQEKLAKKLEEISASASIDEDRLAKEVVLFAEKVDVTEEITRLTSHVKQFEGILKDKKKRIGRELDFLSQEMNREINTIAAKSQEIEITQAVLGAKSALDKIREQLANIE
ncbi:MAG: YicC family protein [Chlamydiia bacterium]|nr:YicC family protein [Chlamydiia bacterium]